MTPIRSRGVLCALMLLTGLPLVAQESATAPVLTSRDSAVAPVPNPYAVPEGTTFLVRLEDKLDTRSLQPGKHFKAKLAEDLVAPNGTTIPRGKKIWGHVSSVEQGLHARMLLSFDQIDTGHGKMPLVATVTGVPGEHAAKQPNAEGEIERKGADKRRMIETAAVGAGLGAVAGAA